MALLLHGAARAQEPESPAPESPAPAEAVEARGAETQSEETLRRAAPIPVQRSKESSPNQRVFERDFEEEKWRGRLNDPDLDARERTYAQVVKRARLDPFARAFLEKLALDTRDRELAWTARLALRELGPAAFPLDGISPDLFALDAGVQRMLSEVLGEVPELGFVLPERGRMRILTGPQGAPGSKGVVVQQGPDSARITVTEKVDGERKERVYEGESLDAILKANPSLAEEVNLTADAIPKGFEMRLEVKPERGAWRGLLTPFAYGERGPSAPSEGQWFNAEEVEGLLAPNRRSALLRTDVLGVRVRPTNAAERQRLGIEGGLTVVHCEPGTIAHRMGIAVGDVLMCLSGDPLSHPEEITERMESRGPGGEVAVSWIDDLGQRQRGTWRADAKH